MKPQTHDVEFSAQPVTNDPSDIPDSPAGQPAGVLKPDIVSNIEVHNPDGQHPAPNHSAPAVHEDDEMDKAMQDVAKQMKIDNKKPPKKHFFSKKTKNDLPAPIHPPPAHPAAAHPATKTATAKPESEKSLPVMVIFLTVVVTAALITAAISAYK